MAEAMPAVAVPNDVLERPCDADPVPGRFDPERAVLFPHIPRTAGSTLKNLLATIYGTERTRLDVHRYENLTDAARDRAAVIEGHKRVPYFSGLFGPEWATNGVTIVREPVSRAISQARHIRARPSVNLWRDHLLPPLAPPDEVFSAVPHLCNLQTGMLAGDVGTQGLPGPEHLDAAKASLDQIAFGLTESFDSSMALVAERFGLFLPPFGKTNASPRKGDDDIRSDAFLAEAERRNALDLELYEYARSLFATRMAAYADALLALPLDEAPFECGVHRGGRPIEQGVVVNGRRGRAKLKGWILVDGHAPDAALIRVGDRIFPVAAGSETPKLGRRNRTWANLYAGVQVKVDIPRDVATFDLIAFDRRRGRRAQQTFRITRQTLVQTEGTRVVRAARRRLRR